MAIFFSGMDARQSESIVKFMEVMQDEFDMDLNKHAPACITKNRPNYKCSHCQTEMMIVGKIERDPNEERAEGKDVVKRYTCYSCLKEMIPVKIS